MRLALVGLALLSAAGAGLLAQRPDEPSSLEQHSLAADSIPPPSASAAPVTQANDYAGVIVPDAVLALTAPHDGRIVTVEVALGDAVEAGAVVATLDDRAQRQALAIARAEFDRLRAEAEIAAVELAEATEIAARRETVAKAVGAAISPEQLAAARFVQLRAVQVVRAARARLEEQRVRILEVEQQLADTRLRAAFPAYVAARHVDPGAFVRRGDAIADLLGASAVRVRFGVPVEGMKDIAVGAAVRVRVEGEDAPVSARIDRIAPAIDAAARLRFVEAALSGAQPGLLGRRARVVFAQ